MPTTKYVDSNDPRVRLARIRTAIGLLRTAQSALRSVGADRAARAVAKARKSIEGAERHADGLVLRQERVRSYTDLHPDGVCRHQGTRHRRDGSVDCPLLREGGSRG